MHLWGIFGGLKRWICFVGCIASMGAAAQDWAQFSCPVADFIVPGDWQVLSSKEKQEIAHRAEVLMRPQGIEAGDSYASKVRHLVMREPSVPTQALIRFVTQRGEFAADIRDALTDDEVFRGVSEAIRTSYPQVIPNFLWFESVSREQINGISALKLLYFRREQLDTQAVWQVRMYMMPLSGDRWATLTLSNDVSASEAIKTAVLAPARTLQLKR